MVQALYYLSITIQENRDISHFQKLNFFFLGFTTGVGVGNGVLGILDETLGVGEGLGETLGVLEGLCEFDG